MTRSHQPPAAIAWMGYGGLTPFAASAITLWLPGMPFALTLFLAYALSILAFLGGMQWGIVVMTGEPGRMHERLVVGVVAPLVGTLALLLAPMAGVVVLAAAFAGLLLWERTRKRPDSPAWYLPLRTRLTAGVLLCHAVAFMGLL